MRTERPGIIQTADQYSLAISLANQMAYSFYYNAVPDSQFLSNLQSMTDQAIATHQTKVESDRMLTQPQQSPTPTTTATKQPEKTNGTSTPSLTKADKDMLKKSKLSTNDYEKYAIAIKKMFVKDRTLTLDLLSKLSVHDRRKVLSAIEKSSPDKNDDLPAKILLASRDRVSDLLHSISTRRSSLDERISQVDTPSPSKMRH